MGCRIWTPQSCCCGCSLKTGCLVLGWITLILFGLDLLSVLILAVSSSMVIEGCVEELTKNGARSQYDADVSCRSIVTPVLIVCGVIFAAVVILSCLLLFGVNKSRPGLMKPYMVGQLVVIVLFIILLLWMLVLAMINGAIGGFFIALVVYSSVIFLQVYLLLVVRACYLQILSEQQFGMNNDPEAQQELHKI